jgi:hypothetical protein
MELKGRDCGCERKGRKHAPTQLLGGEGEGDSFAREWEGEEALAQREALEQDEEYGMENTRGETEGW